MNPADQRHTFTKHEVPHQCVAEGVTGKKCTVSGDTHAAHLTVSWSFLSSGGVTQFRPLVHPHPSSVTQCNLWCWEITEAGRPGRHSQLGRTPPVRWGHSQPQTQTWAFHSFSKASHPCIRRCFSAQCPFTSYTSVYLRQMDRASGPLRLVHHLFHLAWKTSSGLISCNVIGYNSEAGETVIQSIYQKRSNTWETCSGSKKSLLLLHIYLYFHILFTYLFVIITCTLSRSDMGQECKRRACWRNVTFFFFFLTHLVSRASLSSTQPMIFTVPLNKLQQRCPKI